MNKCNFSSIILKGVRKKKDKNENERDTMLKGAALK
jgi:hypothetical protein